MNNILIENLKTSNNAFDRVAIARVLELNKQYRREHPDKFPYNSRLVEYIQNIDNIPADLRDKLNHEVYLSQKDISREKANSATRKP